MKPLDQIFLPKSSRNEELERISLKKFAPLFPENKFILKGEIIDNGVDMRNEIILNNNKLGFGFNFQLKATESINKNNDGSYSKSIDTSNIEYLINNGQPGFYGLYVKVEDKFLFKYLNEFVGELHMKDEGWENQPSHTIRFSEELNEKSVNEIFNLALIEGTKSREILFKTIEIGNLLLKNRGSIILDLDSNSVLDDVSIREYIEENGSYLINSAQWRVILDYHNKATGRVATSSKYCLFVAASFLYSGNLFEAYSWFKKSLKIQDDISSSLANYRTVHFAMLQLRLSIIDDNEYEIKLRSLDNDSVFHLYNKLGKLVADLKNMPNNPSDNFKEFEQKIFQVTNDKSTPINLILLYENEYLLQLGYRFNILFTMSVARIKDAELNDEIDLENIRIEETIACMNRSDHWHSQMNTVIDKAKVGGHYFIFHSSIINEARVIYQFQVFEERFNLTSSENQKEMNNKKLDRLLKLCHHVDQSITFYKTIGHKENLAGALTLLYEIESFKDIGRESSLTKKIIETLIEDIENKSDKEKLIFTLNGGTTHEQFENSMGSNIDQLEEASIVINNLKSEMMRMDKEDESFDRSGSFIQLNLFPIGYFAVPVHLIEDFYKVINASEKAILEVNSMIDMKLIAKLNILYDPIPEEGFLEGYAKKQDINGFKRIHEIRSFLFKSKSYRMKI